MKASRIMHDIDEDMSSQSKMQEDYTMEENVAHVNGSEDRPTTNSKQRAYYEASQLASGGLHYSNRDVGGSAISLSAMLDEEEDIGEGKNPQECKRVNSSSTLLQGYSNAVPGGLKNTTKDAEYSEDAPGIPMSPLRHALTETLNTWSLSLIMVW